MIFVCLTRPDYNDSFAGSRRRGIVPAGTANTYARVTIKTWLDNAIQDAERRGLAALRPLLEALARSTAALRSADWNCDATGEGDPPAPPHVR